MKKNFGAIPGGESVTIYTITSGKIIAHITPLGATLQALYVPDRDGKLADVVLGFDKPEDYIRSGTFFGATVGRNANRLGKAEFTIGSEKFCLGRNEGENNLHSGPDFFKDRLWEVESLEENRICLRLYSPHGDQGFPGNATIWVEYALQGSTLTVRYRAVCDRATVFNLTNHSYFNLAGHDQPEKAMEQIFSMPARAFTVADSKSIPTGEMRSVDGTPMDFRKPKAFRDALAQEYLPLQLQGGIDHNFEVYCNPCATLIDPASGRAMAVSTDCPGIQVYTANFTDEIGKNGAHYAPRSGVALETQFYPDSLHNPQWKQPITPAGQEYKSETVYRFYNV